MLFALASIIEFYQWVRQPVANNVPVRLEFDRQPGLLPYTVTVSILSVFILMRLIFQIRNDSDDPVNYELLSQNGTIPQVNAQIPGREGLSFDFANPPAANHEIYTLNWT